MDSATQLFVPLHRRENYRTARQSLDVENVTVYTVRYLINHTRGNTAGSIVSRFNWINVILQHQLRTKAFGHYGRERSERKCHSRLRRHFATGRDTRSAQRTHDPVT